MQVANCHPGKRKPSLALGMLQAGIEVEICLFLPESSAVCQALPLEVWDMTGQSCADWDPFVQASGDLDVDNLKSLIILDWCKWSEVGGGQRGFEILKPLSLPYVNTWFWRKLQFSNWSSISYDQRLMVMNMIRRWWMLIKNLCRRLLHLLLSILPPGALLLGSHPMSSYCSFR